MAELQGSPRNDERTPPEGEITTPDPVGQAARAVLAENAAAESAAPPKRGRGRPKGSRTRSRSNRQAAPPAGDTKAVSPAPPAEPTEAELEGLGALLGTLWGMAGARLRRRPLTGPERAELSRVAHPVLAKYGGSAFEQWGAEIALGVTLWGLWERTDMGPAPEMELPPEYQEDGTFGA